ncbi:MAG TPA: phosphoglycerate dehydrogenase [Microthrixaceae bacterium]|nr:phosphoglycerate dehydrogenase [Microthrixaceae bacterium]
MARVLVTEAIADRGLDRLRDAGHQVDVRLDLTPETLLDAIRGAQALIVRSATKVTKDVLAAGADLVVVGRAGIGLDNVDTAAATEAGVMVVNAPQSNTLSAAEHTMALLLAQARNVPQAHAALKQGRWERSKWNGVELADKTLGIVGLGRIGKLVAQRCLAFGMKLVAYDPFVSAEAARRISVELVTLDELVARADFVTLHLAKTPETIGLIGTELLAKAKDGIRIVNVARGGIVDEAALYEAVRSGKVAGAALDVFAEEPTTESPLFDLDEVIVTPHLGASTVEAQDKAGDTIADMVLLALAGDFVPYAVNVSAGEVSETVRPYQGLAEKLGRLYAGLAGSSPTALEIEYQGQIAEYDTRILTLSVLKGFFGATSDSPVSYVNAPQLAEERGLEVRPTSTTTSRDYVNLITIRGGDHVVGGTLSGLKSVPKVVNIDDHAVDIPPAPHMLVVRNDDTPGMIGTVGTVLGSAGVNISDMVVGQSADGVAALMVIAIDRPVGADLVEQLSTQPGITSVAEVHS